GLGLQDANGGVLLQDAKNVYATKIGYGPIASLSAVSSSALPTKCLGAVTVRDSNGNYQTFAGTATKLWKWVAGAWSDYSGAAYSVNDGDYWSFALFGSKLIACNINDVPQVIDIDTGATNFSALGGSPPKARYVQVVGDFVILACLNGNNRKLRNSAINDATGW